MDGDESLVVAVIGSSGGGTATLGHTDPISLLNTLSQQVESCRVQLHHALFVSLDDGKGMDQVGAEWENETAKLYRTSPGTQGTESNEAACKIVCTGTLRQVNQYCKREQKKIAEQIMQGHIHGLVCISCDVDLFQETLQAAAERRIAVTGSGGTSLSQAAARYGIVLTGNAGGSVATTSFTRAVSYTHALAAHWGRTYEPWKTGQVEPQKNRPSMTSVLNACLPAFWGVMLSKAFLRMLAKTVTTLSPSLPLFGATDNALGVHLMPAIDSTIFALENHILPAVCSVVMAVSYSPADHDTQNSSGTSSRASATVMIMAALLASASCGRSVLAGLLAGVMVARLTDRTLYQCIFSNIPATMTNMITAGGVGGLLCAIILLPISIVLRQITLYIRWCIMASVSWESSQMRLASGFLWGTVSCYGSKVGWYHGWFLPLVLIEMELGNASFLGAIDVLTLVLVCGGICAGALLCQNSGVSAADAALCKRALTINLSCGDFVEACYPLMEKNIIINVGGYLASGLSTAWLVRLPPSSFDAIPKSLAYLPLPLSIALGESSWCDMAMASLIAFGTSFLFTVIGLYLHFKVEKNKAA